MCWQGGAGGEGKHCHHGAPQLRDFLDPELWAGKGQSWQGQGGPKAQKPRASQVTISKDQISSVDLNICDLTLEN